MNARFWAYCNGPVKITLRPGQSLAWCRFERTEEGCWSSEFCRWEFDGYTVTRECGTDGVDCDGRLSTGYTDSCPLDMLHAGNTAWPEGCFEYPAWESEEYSRRDYQAEAAGY